MRAGAHCIIVGLLAVMLGSCAWLAELQTDRAHLISEMTDTAAADNAKCQSPGHQRIKNAVLYLRIR
jgi:hypothetical protein